MAKVGRPKAEFDWNLVDALCMNEATQEFIAERLIIADGVNPHEINKKMIVAKIKMIQCRITERWGCNFLQYRDKRMEGRRMKLRQLQWKSAEAGNVTMQIFLGKQYLGQSDKNDSNIASTVQVQQPEPKITPDEYFKSLEYYRKKETN